MTPKTHHAKMWGGGAFSWLTSGIVQWDLDICHKPHGYIALWQKSINHAFVTVSKFIIMWAASCISYELRNVHTIRRAQWYFARKEWKINDVEVKIIMLVIKPGWKFTSTVYQEFEIKVVCQVIWFVSFLNNQLGWLYLFEIIQNRLVIRNNPILKVVLT